MNGRALITAWLVLTGLSLASTLIASLPPLPGGPVVAGVVVLGLAWLKARVILSQYLGLIAAPAWRRGFGLTLALFCLVLGALYALPVMV